MECGKSGPGGLYGLLKPGDVRQNRPHAVSFKDYCDFWPVHLGFRERLSRSLPRVQNGGVALDECDLGGDAGPSERLAASGTW